MQRDCKRTMKHCICKEDYFNEYLKSCTCLKSIMDDLVITCDEIADTLKTVSIKSFDKKGTDKIDYYIFSIFSSITIYSSLLLTVTTSDNG